MPIRDLEWYVQPASPVEVHANRGANGIDGVVSTAVGLALAGAPRPTVLLIGDVAFLHDSNGLLGAVGRGIDLVVVVVDNDGGGIFSFLPQAGSVATDTFETLFGTPHGLDLVPLAAAYGATAAPVRRRRGGGRRRARHGRCPRPGRVDGPAGQRGRARAPERGRRRGGHDDRSVGGRSRRARRRSVAGMPVRRTKIVATIGPASDPPAVLQGLLEAGVDVCRLGLAHGPLEATLDRIDRVRVAARRCRTAGGDPRRPAGPEGAFGALPRRWRAAASGRLAAPRRRGPERHQRRRGGGRGPRGRRRRPAAGRPRRAGRRRRGPRRSPTARRSTVRSRPW